MNRPHSSAILQVEDLSKIFETKKWFKRAEQFVAVDHISFDLKEGEILGLLGPNGAGKTTTIQMLLGLLTPSSGTIHYFGQDFYKHRSQVMQQVAFASSYLKLPGSLSIEENLQLYAKLYCIPSHLRQTKIEKVIEIFGLANLRKRLTKTLSAGQLTRVMLAKAFLPEPKIVLLDEPTAALDPDIAIQVREFILDQRHTLGSSVLFTSHNMAEVEEVCDRVLILKDGRILASETPAKLAATVKKSKVHLLVIAHMDQLISYLQRKGLAYKLEQGFVGISVDDVFIPDLLVDITKLQVRYSQISIDKPTLEDYFLEISQ